MFEDLFKQNTSVKDKPKTDNMFGGLFDVEKESSISNLPKDIQKNIQASGTLKEPAPEIKKKWIFGTDWIKNVFVAGYKSVESSVKNTAEGLGKITENLVSDKPFQAYNEQPGWSFYNDDGTPNPNYEKELKANQDYLKSQIKNPLQRGVAMGEGVVQIGSLYFTQVMAELEASKQLPGVLSWPGKAVSYGFEKLGELGGFVSDKGIDYLPISSESKETIRPLAEEIGAFITKLVGVKVAHTAMKTGGGKVVEKLPISEKAKGKIQTGVQVGVGMSMQPFSTAFKLGNAKILTKIAERKAKNIEITPEETKVIITEIKNELPSEIIGKPIIEKVETPTEPIIKTEKTTQKSTSRQFLDNTRKLFNTDTVTKAQARENMKDSFTPQEIENIIKDIPLKIKGEEAVMNTEDVIRSAELNNLQRQREGTPATKKTTPKPTNLTPGEIKTKITENTKGYQTYGGFGVGKESPNAYLRDLNVHLNTEEGMKIGKESVDNAISKGEIKPDANGDVTLYRVGKLSGKNDLVSATYDKNFAQQFSDANKQPITEIKVKPEDIKYVIGGVEKEVLLSKKITTEKTAQNIKEKIATNKATKETKKGEQAGKLPVPDKNAPKGAKNAKNEALQSRVYERMKQEHPELTGDLTYNEIKLKEDAKKAVELVAKDPQKAYEVAMGAREIPGQTSTAVNIALAEKALQEKNYTLYSQLIKSRSLEQTRRGQELVAEKGSVDNNDTSKYVKELINERMTKLGKKLGNIFDTLKGKKRSDNKKAVEKIDKEVKKAQSEIKNKELDIKEAQSILDALVCK